MGIHVSGVHDGRDFHIIAAQLGSQRAPLIEEATTLIGPVGAGTLVLLSSSVSAGKWLRMRWSRTTGRAQAGCGEVA